MVGVSVVLSIHVRGGASFRWGGGVGEALFAFCSTSVVGFGLSYLSLGFVVSRAFVSGADAAPDAVGRRVLVCVWGGGRAGEEGWLRCECVVAGGGGVRRRRRSL